LGPRAGPATPVRIATEVANEEAAKDATFKRVWDSYRTFREEYSLWTSYGYMK
jgi:TRAP-type mannitol/chloroaromatic compound transport system substrate-binding protein